MSTLNNQKLNAALQYQAMGLSIIPVGADKISLISWKIYQERCATKDEIVAWWTQWPDANPALVTGKVSGIVALDLDRKHGRTASEFDISPTASARSGGGGEHFFFKHPGRPVATAAGIAGLGVDIRGDGGYILLAPSVNAQGGLYEWVVSLEDGMADMPEWLLNLATQAVPESKWLEGRDGVSNGKRNETAASMAGKLLREMVPDLWESVGWLALKAWNAQNKPPMQEKELRSVWISVQKYHQPIAKKDGAKLDSAMSLSDLLNKEFPAVRFTVEQLIESETINMLAAPPNKWKSWILLLAAISVASGEPLFGHFATAQQPVLIVNEEDNERMLQERLRMLMGEKTDLPIYFHVGKGIKLDAASVGKIITEAKEKQVGCIMFDSLRSVHDADENSSKEMQLIMDQLKRITRQKITVIFAHHNRKKMRMGGGKEDWDDARGSTAINAAVHGHLACDEYEKDGVKYLIVAQHKLKAAAKINPFEVRLEITKEPNKMHFVYQGEHKSQQQEVSKAYAALLETFDKSDKGLSVNDLLQLKICSQTLLRITLQRLQQENLVQVLTVKDAQAAGLPLQNPGGKHNAKVYFRAAQLEDDGIDYFESLPPADASLLIVPS